MGHNLKKKDRVNKQNMEFLKQDKWAAGHQGCCTIHTTKLNKK